VTTRSPLGVPVLPGAPEPLANGELVVLIDRKKRRYLLTLVAGQQWHSHAGGLDHDALIGQPEGSAARTNKNMEVTVLRPTREDYALKMRRGAQVIYPKDQAMIVSLADVRPGCTVVEAGAGSGALTMALLAAVGPTGRVISYERRADHLEHAIRNVEQWHGERPPNWEVHEGDLVAALPTLRAHRVILDLLEPWTLVDGAVDCLAPGGIVLAYTPTVPQVMRFAEALDVSGAFTDRRTSETLLRTWNVDGLAVRPDHRMVAHTSFLTTARRVLPVEDGGPGASLGKTSGIAWPAVDALAD